MRSRRLAQLRAQRLERSTARQEKHDDRDSCQLLVLQQALRYQLTIAALEAEIDRLTIDKPTET